MADFNAFLAELRGKIPALATGALKDFGEQLKKDTEDFIKDSEADLKSWTLMLGMGQMSREAFELAVKGRAQIARMVAIKQSVMAQAEVDRARETIKNAVVMSAIKHFM
jgi:hypothetical protein